MFQDSNTSSKVQKTLLKSKRIKTSKTIRKKQTHLKKSPYYGTSSTSKNKSTSRCKKTSKGNNNVPSKQEDTFFGTTPYTFFSTFVKHTVSSILTEATFLVHFDQKFEQAWQISIEDVLSEASNIVDDLENSIKNSL